MRFRLDLSLLSRATIMHYFEQRQRDPPRPELARSSDDFHSIIAPPSQGACRFNRTLRLCALSPEKLPRRCVDHNALSSAIFWGRGLGEGAELRSARLNRQAPSWSGGGRLCRSLIVQYQGSTEQAPVGANP